ncbi:MAG: hypothetical protein PVSMB7_17410 [Chloroflexota bacterium]
MNLTQTSVLPAVRAAAHTAGTMPLAGTVLVVARSVWAAVVGLSTALFLIGLPHFVDTTSHPSTTVNATLRQSGIPVEVYAGTILALVLSFVTLSYTAALWMFLKRSNDPSAVFVSLLLVAVAASFGTPELHANPILEVGQAVREWVTWTALPMFFYVFPTGRFVPGWTKITALIWGVMQLIVIAGLPAGPFIFIALLPLLASGFYAQIIRYRRVSDLVQRQQLKWVIAGFTVAVAGLVGIQIVQAVNIPSLREGTAGGLFLSGVLVACVVQIPLSLAFAVLRYRLFDIHVVINRTVVYVLLSAAVSGVYIMVAGGLGVVFRGNSGAVPPLLAAALVALLFAPLRDRLQRTVNRLMYGRRDEPYTVLSSLGQRLGSALAVEDVLQVVVETVSKSLKLPYAAIFLHVDGALVPAAAVGTSAGSVLTVPLTYGTEMVGALHVAPRSQIESLRPSDLRLIQDVARQAGVAAHGVRVTLDLQRAREHLVLTREEERRRLRRDLHDGLGPSLASVTLMAQAAGNLLDTDPAGARALLAELRDEAQSATGEIRRVVYQLRPPVLDELGLLGALNEQAAAHSPAGLHVSVVAPDGLPPLPAAIEVAAYRVVQESLANVIRHADARWCEIRLQVGTSLEIEIADDGVGLDESRRGVGLTAMHERAEELGGTCAATERGGGGTLVRMTLPLPRNSGEDL